MAKRKVSTANVSSKAKRVGKEVEKLVAGNAALQWQDDLSWINKRLHEVPERLDAVKAVLKIEDAEKHDPSTTLHPFLLGKTIMKLPPRYIIDEVFAAVEGAPNAGVCCALNKVDKFAVLRLFLRVACLIPRNVIPTVVKSDLKDMLLQRMQLIGYNWSCFAFDKEFNILWDKPYVGVYTLLPVCCAENPSDHTYTHIWFQGQAFVLDKDVVARGNFAIAENWSIFQAAMFNPDKPWIRAPCHTCISEQLMNTLAPPFQPTLTSSSSSPSSKKALEDSKMQCIGDDSSKSSSPLSKTDASSIGAETDTLHGSEVDNTSPGKESVPEVPAPQPMIAGVVAPKRKSQKSATIEAAKTRLRVQSKSKPLDADA
eukprot:557008-Amphidinium_carterae.3